jgi:glycosyltransferase involved in cell wall biosynthesis
MRIAWLGPTPNLEGGAPYVGAQLLRELARAGARVDCFLDVGPDQVPPPLCGLDGLRFVLRPTRWQWDRWYNRTPMSAFVSGNMFRLRAHNELARSVAAHHAAAPYDVVYQFSRNELGQLARLLDSLPPIVVHPSTHAAGELRWYRREAPLARPIEPRSRRMLVGSVLRLRASIQRRDLARVDRILAISHRFAEHLAADYRIPRERLGIVPNPIDLDRFRPDRRPIQPVAPLKLLFVSRIAVRKGVEMIVDLSHRLDDLHGKVEIIVIGSRSTWSDYRKLLEGLNPRVARYSGGVQPGELAALYREAAAVLQPSHYEPFALTVGEALAAGTPVIASDEVGAVEGVDRRVATIFPRGDRVAFEQAAREAVAVLSTTEQEAVATLARAEAERLYAPATVAEKLLEELERVRAPMPKPNPNPMPVRRQQAAATSIAAGPAG